MFKALLSSSIRSLLIFHTKRLKLFPFFARTFGCAINQICDEFHWSLKAAWDTNLNSPLTFKSPTICFKRSQSTKQREIFLSTLRSLLLLLLRDERKPKREIWRRSSEATDTACSLERTALDVWVGSCKWVYKPQREKKNQKHKERNNNKVLLSIAWARF